MEEKSETTIKFDPNLGNSFKSKLASTSNSKNKAKLDIGIKNRLIIVK